MDKSRFINVYANLPIKLRNQIVVVVNGQPLTWNAAHMEIKNETQLGEKILKKLIEMKIV